MIVRISTLMIFLAFLGCWKGEKNETHEAKLDDAFLIENLDIDLHYFFEPVLLSEAMALEDSLSAQNQKSDKNRIGRALSQFVPGLKYQRPRVGLLRPEALYIYSKTDSVVRYIQYTFAVETEDSTQKALAEDYYFSPTSGLYAYLKSRLVEKFGEPTSPEMEQYIRQKPAGILEMRASEWKKEQMNITLQVVESQIVSIKISFPS